MCELDSTVKHFGNFAILDVRILSDDDLSKAIRDHDSSFSDVVRVYTLRALLHKDRTGLQAVAAISANAGISPRRVVQADKVLRTCQYITVTPTRTRRGWVGVSDVFVPMPPSGRRSYVPTAWMLDRRLSPAALKLLIVAARWANEDGCFLSKPGESDPTRNRAELFRVETGLDRRTVKTGLRLLREVGAMRSWKAPLHTDKDGNVVVDRDLMDDPDASADASYCSPAIWVIKVDRPDFDLKAGKAGRPGVMQKSGIRDDKSPASGSAKVRHQERQNSGMPYTAKVQPKDIPPNIQGQTGDGAGLGLGDWDNWPDPDFEPYRPTNGAPPETFAAKASKE